MINFFCCNYDNLDKTVKKKDSVASGQSADVKKKEKDSNNVKKENEEKTGVINNKIAKVEGSDIGEEGKNAEKKQGETATGQTKGSVKSVKKKVIKKVVKQKVANKANDTTSKQMDKLDEKNSSEKMATSSVPVQQDGSSAGPCGVQTPEKSLVAEAVSVGKTEGVEEKVNEINSPDGKPQDKPETTDTPLVGDATVKTTIKKKVIKRVPKKKVVGEASKSVVSDPKINDGNVVAVQAQDGSQSISKQTSDADTIVNEVKKPMKVAVKKKLKTATAGKQDGTSDSNKMESKSGKNNEENVVAVKENNDTHSTGKLIANADTTVTEVKKTGKVVPKKKSKASTSEKQDGDVVNSNKTETKSNKEDKKDERGIGEKSGARVDKQKASEKDIHNVKGKQKDGDKSKERDGKDEAKSKSSKEVKEKRKSDEPPRHPGFILQTKCTKDSKVW